MTAKTPETERWGGPGSSHQDRDQSPPDPVVKDPDDPDHLSDHSRVSGGGGERDVHKGHAPEMKRDRQASSEEQTVNQGRRPYLVTV